jgi:hypothetical protein
MERSFHGGHSLHGTPTGKKKGIHASSGKERWSKSGSFAGAI